MLLVVALGVLALAAACSERDPEAEEPTATARTTQEQLQTPSPTPTVTPEVGRDTAERLARSPAYFIYVVGAGDTIAVIADIFDGVLGSADPAYEAELREANELGDGRTLPVGYQLGIPLRLPTADALFQHNTIVESLRASATGQVTEFLYPGEDLRNAFQGQIALYRLELENGDAPGEGRGYYAIYSRTDRVAVKAGELDTEARNVEVEFATAGGSLVDRMLADYPDSLVWRLQANLRYTLATRELSAFRPETISSSLEIAE